LVAGKANNLQEADTGQNQLQPQHQTIEINDHMKTKLLPLLVPTILIIGVLGTCPFASAQTEISPAPTPLAQPARSPQMQGMEGMDKMADSVTKMSEMCQIMMKKEMAGAHYKMAAGAAFGVVLFLDLLLLVVLEIQWIIYWGRKLKSEK